MPVAESNIYAFWVAAQTGKGTPATAATKRPIVVAGDLDLSKDDGSENFSDLDRFGDQSDYVNTVTGGGSLTVEAQTNELAYLCWLFFGNETFTALVAGTTPPTYVFTPGANTGKWATFWKRVGMGTIVRRKFNDCRISSIRFEGSTANKIVKVIPNIISLDPGEVFATDPTPGLNTTQDPLVYTEGKGTFTLDGTVFTGHSQFAVVVDDGLAPVYGDDVVPYELVPGNANIMLDGITMLLDDTALARYNTLVYGTAAPAAGTKPLKSIPPTGSYTFDITRGTLAARQRFKLEIAGVKWNPDVAIPPNPDGGAIELAFGGSMRKVAGQPAIRITVETGTGDNLAHTV